MDWLWSMWHWHFIYIYDHTYPIRVNVWHRHINSISIVFGVWCFIDYNFAKFYHCHTLCIIVQTQKNNPCMLGVDASNSMEQLHSDLSSLPQFLWAREEKDTSDDRCFSHCGCCCSYSAFTCTEKTRMLCGRSLGAGDRATHAFLPRCSRKLQKVLRTKRYLGKVDLVKFAKECCQIHVILKHPD